MPGFDPVWSIIRSSKPFNLPGFSDGTLSIAYVLGTVSLLASEPALADAAADGFAYIDSIAQVLGDRVRIPYGWPAENWEGRSSVEIGHSMH